MNKTGQFLLIALVIVAAGVPAVAEIRAPRDSSTGMASGKRMHKPLIITKDWSDRTAANADCAKVGGTVGAEDGKLVCMAQADADADQQAACAKVAVLLPGAACVAKTSAQDDWHR